MTEYWSSLRVIFDLFAALAKDISDKQRKMLGFPNEER